AQTKVSVSLATSSLKLYLTHFRQVAAFAQFDSNLDAPTRFLLARGAHLTELLPPSVYSPNSSH
ncbi:hypothetical protein EDB84DRAFT_1266688, partial [Lactarius hengduanensis]